MSSATDLERIRWSDAQARQDEGRRPSTYAPGSAAILARTKLITTYPTTAAAFYGMEPLALLGTETEGSVGIRTPSGQTFVALNLGTTVPPQGTELLVTFVANRWVFRYD